MAPQRAVSTVAPHGQPYVKGSTVELFFLLCICAGGALLFICAVAGIRG